MINSGKFLTSLSALERFTDDALKMKHHSGYLSGFHFNREFLRAAVANTYLETVGNRSDSIHPSMWPYSKKHSKRDKEFLLFQDIVTMS